MQAAVNSIRNRLPNLPPAARSVAASAAGAVAGVALSLFVKCPFPEITLTKSLIIVPGVGLVGSFGFPVDQQKHGAAFMGAAAAAWLNASQEGFLVDTSTTLLGVVMMYSGSRIAVVSVEVYHAVADLVSVVAHQYLAPPSVAPN